MNKKLLLSIVFAIVGMIANTSAQNGCAGQFKTFTIGGWGTVCNGGNPGCYRDANFAAAFPNGLTIGCGSNTLTLTSSLAVQNFLPSGGTPAVLSGASVNPGGSISNTLASQLVGVTLALGFDAYDPNFSASANSFGSLVILQGPHAGMTVAQFLQLANNVIGGCSSAYTPSQINATATAINENYDNGTIDNGYLDCTNFRIGLIVGSDVTCNGGQNGHVDVTVTGGVPPYYYMLNNGSASGATNQTTYTFNGLGAGSYTVTVTDSNNQMASGSNTFSIGQPSLITATTSSTPVSCFGGSNGTASVSNIAGGVGPYTVLWSTGSSANTITGLTAGSYTVIITDSNQCSVEKSVMVNQPTLLGYSSSTNDALCYGVANGSATITPNGGTAPYTILWSNGSTSFTRNDLMANTVYTAVITDNNSCTINVSVSVGQPSPVAIGTTTSQAVCVGGNGSATATPSGGTAPYSYSWNTNPVQTSATAQLPLGTWTVTVTDANGCVSSAQVTITLLTCEGFTTVTQGGYGAKCAGNNWGCYVKNNFATAFPTGLTIGSGTRFLRLTSATAVQNFLPSGSTPRALNPGTLVNPSSNAYSNVLAGQTVALTLSLGFDAANPNFSSSSTPLGSLVVTSGTFIGMTVTQLLNIANTVLGGGTSPYTASQINGALDAVNNNYDGGTMNLGYLACPCPTNRAEAEALSQVVTKFDMYPNPSRAASTIEFMMNYNTTAKVMIYNMNGQLISSLFDSNVLAEVKTSISIDTSNLKTGVYIVKLVTVKETVNKSLLVIE
ncbi:T9SS type A sorting domain-containing protein [Flavobacterium capsici]|uniref:T9SS type A sorting domain-containing protein n=1 Tax=Flavobacterium capsici TaxID=3075618 RepID=A0AA96F0I8_9FLAO|nr:MULTISPECIES: T9SS type A sorting domain-containing protein [unclassified Flavobacterium]WNM17886.1 T9SS type A sorting domain-containing protein [Flavobacterium sp. PMR2A8]WNM21939.1 T9SS type A sorting domain-containing protein [Flavobacterium sp. PMTSA4]